MKTIMANIWGAQKKVHLGTWAEIRKYGFRPSHRAFGTLNDGTQALYLYIYMGKTARPKVPKMVCYYRNV